MTRETYDTTYVDDGTCGRCGARLHGLRCGRCHPWEATAPEVSTVDVGMIARWIEMLSNITVMNAAFGATPDEMARAARLLFGMVREAGEGDVGLGIERLQQLTRTV